VGAKRFISKLYADFNYSKFPPLLAFETISSAFVGYPFQRPEIYYPIFFLSGLLMSEVL